jgi:hypothetical protein
MRLSNDLDAAEGDIATKAKVEVKLETGPGTRLEVGDQLLKRNAELLNSLGIKVAGGEGSNGPVGVVDGRSQTGEESVDQAALDAGELSIADISDGLAEVGISSREGILDIVESLVRERTALVSNE